MDRKRNQSCAGGGQYVPDPSRGENCIPLESLSWIFYIQRELPDPVAEERVCTKERERLSAGPARFST